MLKPRNKAIIACDDGINKDSIINFLKGGLGCNVIEHDLQEVKYSFNDKNDWQIVVTSLSNIHLLPTFVKECKDKVTFYLSNRTILDFKGDNMCDSVISQEGCDTPYEDLLENLFLYGAIV